MGKQKLPENWATHHLGAYCRTHDRSVEVTTDHELMIESMYNDYTESCPVSVALAAIRNANLDPVYEMARKLVMMQRNQENLGCNAATAVFLELWELNRLIESLEEP